MSLKVHLRPLPAVAWKAITTSIGASTLMLLATVDIAQADDGYVQVEIHNHKNNSELGYLRIYVASYDGNGNLANPTDIPTSGTTQENGLGWHQNGSGVTYLVDDYLPLDTTNSKMPQQGPVDPSTNLPKWRGFQINTPVSAGPAFIIGFGCDQRRQVNNTYDYSHLTHADSACINYDAPYDIGLPVHEITGPIAPVWNTSYAESKGFNIRYAAFEAAFYAPSTLGVDKANLTNINYYGFPMGITAAHRDSEHHEWIQTADKKYKHNDHMIRTALKHLLSEGGAAWYYSVEDKFIRAVSPQSFPVITDDWHPIPQKIEFSRAYLTHLQSTYKCADGNTWTINGPYSDADDHPFTGTSTTASSYQCEACFQSNGGLLLRNYTLLTDKVAPPGTNDLFSNTYHFRFKVPPNSGGPDAWGDLEHFILSGDPGGSMAVAEYQKPGDSTWVHVPVIGAYAYHIPLPDNLHGSGTGACCITPQDCQQLSKGDCTTQYGYYQGDDTICNSSNCNPGHDYTNAVKASAKQAAFPIQFGWLGNEMTVAHHVVEGTKYYVHSTTAPDRVRIGALTPGKMQWVVPIYEFQKEDGTSENWYDRWGQTIYSSQYSDDVAAYFTGYTDVYKYGRVQVNSHSAKYNRIQLLIPDLTASCASDFNNNGNNDSEDLLILLNSWGTIDCDLNVDLTTDIMDLLQLLADWGLCTQA